VGEYTLSPPTRPQFTYSPPRRPQMSYVSNWFKYISTRIWLLYNVATLKFQCSIRYYIKIGRQFEHRRSCANKWIRCYSRCSSLTPTCYFKEVLTKIH
jgi:hypothetical protein